MTLPRLMFGSFWLFLDNDKKKKTIDKDHLQLLTSVFSFLFTCRVAIHKAVFRVHL